MTETGLQRFVSVQDPVFDTVLSELKAGRKHTHWMWFVFPQIDGLGQSSMARHFAIRSLEEADGYVSYPILGPRLEQCTELVLHHAGKPIGSIFDYPDDLKFHSSMTLFSHTAQNPHLFRRALDAFFSGKPEKRTLALI